MTAILDKFLGKWASRKLTVFAIACLALFMGKIDSQDFTFIAVSYMVMQGIVDAKWFLEKFKTR